MIKRIIIYGIVVASCSICTACSGHGDWQKNSVPDTTLRIDNKTLKEWSAPYRGWHYHPDHVIPPAPKISGFEDVLMTDVPTVFPGVSKFRIVDMKLFNLTMFFT